MNSAKKFSHLIHDHEDQIHQKPQLPGFQIQQYWQQHLLQQDYCLQEEKILQEQRFGVDYHLQEKSLLEQMLLKFLHPCNQDNISKQILLLISFIHSIKIHTFRCVQGSEIHQQLLHNQEEHPYFALKVSALACPLYYIW